MIEYKGASVKELFFQKIEEEVTNHHLIQEEFSPSDTLMSFTNCTHIANLLR